MKGSLHLQVTRLQVMAMLSNNFSTRVFFTITVMTLHRVIFCRWSFSKSSRPLPLMETHSFPDFKLFLEICPLLIFHPLWNVCPLLEIERLLEHVIITGYNHELLDHLTIFIEIISFSVKRVSKSRTQSRK